MSVIEFARQRMEEESREPDGGDCRYWRGLPGWSLSSGQGRREKGGGP